MQNLGAWCRPRRSSVSSRWCPSRSLKTSRASVMTLTPRRTLAQLRAWSQSHQASCIPSDEPEHVQTILVLECAYSRSRVKWFETLAAPQRLCNLVADLFITKPLRSLQECLNRDNRNCVDKCVVIMRRYSGQRSTGCRILAECERRCNNHPGMPMINALCFVVS